MNAIVPATTIEQPPKLPAIASGGAVRAIVPQDFDSAWRIANAVVKAGMAPKGLETAEKAMVAIMHGLEVGLTPMNALQSIAVVNSKPTIYGDGAIGLVRGSGLLEWMEEKFEGADETDDAFRATCTLQRRGEPKPTRYSFSIGDAKKAQLTGKAGPWQQYPKRMLQMRARAFALRDGFADVLKGLSIREEIEDYPVRDVTPQRDAGPPAPPPRAEHKPQPAPQQDPVTIVEAGRDNGEQVEWSDVDQSSAPLAPGGDEFANWRKDAEGALSGCTDPDSFFSVNKKIIAPAKGKVSAADWDAVALVSKQTFDRLSMAD